MELIVRKAQEKDLDGLDQVMLVISDRAGDRETVKTLLRKIDGDPQKYLLVAEEETGDCEAFILKLTGEEQEDYTYVPVEDEVEFSAVLKVFEELLEDTDFER